MSKQNAKETRAKASLEEMTMMDNEFMTAVLTDNIEATELIIRTILGKPSLRVVSQQAQRYMKNLKGRSSILDVFAVDETGAIYDIEFQNDSYGAQPARARYYGALMDANGIESGRGTEELPIRYVIFITRDDVLGGGLPVYHVCNWVHETDEAFNDGGHIVYVNTSYTGDLVDLDLANLIADFRCTDPAKMHFKELAGRAGSLKGMQGGAVGMSWEDVLDEGREEGYAQGRLDASLEMVKLFVAKFGIDPEEAIAAASLSPEIADAVRSAIK